MPSAAQQLDLGKLMRTHAMVTAAQVEATTAAGIALTTAYMRLRNEIRLVLEGDGLNELREEFDRLFPALEAPPPMNDRYLLLGANDALVNLRQLGGWVQGLIDELTFEWRTRIEAEEKAKVAAKPSTGFGAGRPEAG